MTTTQALKHMFGMNVWVANENLAGITHEESLIRAAANGSHLNWIFGHITQTRYRVLRGFGHESLLPDDVTRSYTRGLGDDSIILPFSELIDAFHRSSELLFAALASATEESLAGPAPFSPGADPKETLGSLLVTCAMHESYHLGQVGILRRIIGKEGAINTPPGLL